MGSHSSGDINLPKETRVVFNTTVFVPAVVKLLNPAYPDYEDELAAYGKFIEKCHFLVVSGEIIEEYCKVIAEEPFNFSPSMICTWRMGELGERGKLRNADRKLGKEIRVKVKIHEDDLHLLKAAIVLSAQFIVTEDGGFLQKADEVFREHQVKILNARTYVADYC